MRKFKMLAPRFTLKEGEIVYEYHGPTYGLVTEDMFYTKEEHIAVSREEGKYPFFTAPMSILEEIKSVS